MPSVFFNTVLWEVKEKFLLFELFYLTFFFYLHFFFPIQMKDSFSLTLLIHCLIGEMISLTILSSNICTMKMHYFIKEKTKLLKNGCWPQVTCSRFIFWTNLSDLKKVVYPFEPQEDSKIGLIPFVYLRVVFRLGGKQVEKQFEKF